MHQITQYHRAGFPALWVETAEADRTVSAMREALTNEGVTCATWDVLRGVKSPSGDVDADPVEAIEWLGSAQGPTVLVCSLLHKFADSAPVQQAILTGAPMWKATERQLVIVVPPGTKPPTEIARVVHVLDEALPSVKILHGIVSSLASENSVTVDADATAEALRGLTVAEAENLVALSAVRGDGSVDVADVQTEAARTIKAASGGTLELVRPEGGFDTLGGLDQVKSFCGRAARSLASRGVILLGVPGGGKTALACALGAEVGLPVYLWDVARLFGSLVGESEQAAKRTIDAIDAAGRCVVLIDEIEKGCAGMAGGSGDSGTTQRTMGTILKWLSDRQPGGAFVIATCNDVKSLPPEMQRAERWDGVFFVDLPNPTERAAIFAIHAERFGISESFPADMTDGWTGAEIKSLCRLADMLGVPLSEAAQYVVPLSRSRGDEIQALRKWAQGRCVPASVPTTIVEAPPKRKVRRSTAN